MSSIMLRRFQMKRIFLTGICILVFALIVSNSHAQTGGMMGDQKGEMEKSQMMEQKGMMDQSKTMESMMDMTKQMSEMMKKMSGMMKDMSSDKSMKRMSKMMKDMSKQMMEMSKVMEKGIVSKLKMNIIQNELGKPPEKIFKNFDIQPRASASIGQVHNARLHDDTPVVVKVQRIGVEAQVKQDLKGRPDVAFEAAPPTEIGTYYDIEGW